MSNGSVVICFTRWTRKRYAVLLSLSMVVKIGVLSLAYSLVNTLPELKAQSDTSGIHTRVYEIEEIAVVGRGSNVVNSGISRMVTVIQRDEIEQATIGSAWDLLEFVSNLDVRQRGAMGIQSDISIRGSSFDHVMVLLNGINLSDPQTGHLNSDLAIDKEAIERIEILEGPAARVLGPGAFMGAINIITRKGQENYGEATFGAGGYGYLRGHVHAGFKKGATGNFISGSYGRSDGYARNTDYRYYNVYGQSTYRAENTTIECQVGYQSKAFGAAWFYSPRFPNQYEEMQTGFASLKTVTEARVRTDTRLYWRGKRDHFMLDRDIPGFYENHHLTGVYGGQFNLSVGNRQMRTTLGIDLRSENIRSNVLGYEQTVPMLVKGYDSVYYTRQYGRTNTGLFFEQVYKKGNVGITAGTMVNWNTGFAGKPSVFPGLELSYTGPRNLVFFANVNKALHLPTFTDMFYEDPVNKGKIDLDPNSMIATEGGLKFLPVYASIRLSGFYNKGSHIIDWLWSYEHKRFSPVNISKWTSRGISFSFSSRIPGERSLSTFLSFVALNYLYLDIQKSVADSVSKYTSLKQKLSVLIIQPLPARLSLSWNISFQDRYGEAITYNTAENTYYTLPYKPFWLINATLRWKSKYVELFTELTNMLNIRYIDAGSAVQPGRWLSAGLAVKFP